MSDGLGYFVLGCLAASIVWMVIIEFKCKPWRGE